jgi:hypothetical protein
MDRFTRRVVRGPARSHTLVAGDFRNSIDLAQRGSAFSGKKKAVCVIPTGTSVRERSGGINVKRFILPFRTRPIASR